MEIHVSAHGRITQTRGPWDTMLTWKKVSGHVRNVEVLSQREGLNKMS